MAKQKVLRIVAKREGFRRAGIAHSQTPTDHPIEALSDAQIEALTTDPMLVVEEREIETKAPEAPANKPAKGGGKTQPES